MILLDLPLALTELTATSGPRRRDRRRAQRSASSAARTRRRRRCRGDDGARLGRRRRPPAWIRCRVRHRPPAARDAGQPLHGSRCGIWSARPSTCPPVRSRRWWASRRAPVRARSVRASRRAASRARRQLIDDRLAERVRAGQSDAVSYVAADRAAGLFSNLSVGENLVIRLDRETLARDARAPSQPYARDQRRASSEEVPGSRLPASTSASSRSAVETSRRSQSRRPSAPARAVLALEEPTRGVSDLSSKDRDLFDPAPFRP